MIKKRTCYTQKNFKISIKSWNNTKKVHRVIKLNQESWLKLYIDTNAEVRKKTKNNFEKYFFKLIKMQFLENHENCEKT